MYYKTKAIRVWKDGSISVTAAASNIRPIEYRTHKYRGTLAELIFSMGEGNFRLGNNKRNRPFLAIEKVYRNVERYLDKKGLVWRVEYIYKLNDRDNALKFASEVLAERYLAGLSPEWFASKLVRIDRFKDIVNAGKENLKKRIEQDKTDA